MSVKEGVKELVEQTTAEQPIEGKILDPKLQLNCKRKGKDREIRSQNEEE